MEDLDGAKSDQVALQESQPRKRTTMHNLCRTDDALAGCHLCYEMKVTLTLATQWP